MRARVRAVDRHGGASCARAGCRWCRSRRQRPLCEFDVIGISLQYELTYTNVLTLLDLGGIPLRAAERAADAPLVLVGGPTATHPEPMAPFIDAAFIGEAEELLPPLVLAWAAMRSELAAGRARAPTRWPSSPRRFPLYVPSLYATEIDAATGMTVVGAPLDPRVPARVGRAMVEDLDRVPVPDATRRCRTPRRCSSAPRSRSRAAAPRAAGSARPA